MKKNILIACFLAYFSTSFAQQRIVTTDIKNFWQAYDQIKLTTDSAKQVDLINQHYIQKGTPGLKALMQVRNYNAQGFVNAIKNYPQFWASVRNNTLKADDYAKEIEKAVILLKELYPELKPATIYFSIGALRTGGTTLEDKVLIGAEISMTDEKTNTEELQKGFPHLPGFFKTRPIDGLVFTNTHEYVHTQQKTTIGNTLLTQVVIEGVAELLAEKSLKVASPNPQIAFGKANDAKIKVAFEKEMFSSSVANWLYNSPNNEFKMRDLGYYVGYAICEKFYNLSKNKKAAIKEMIELDYNKEEDLIAFVEKSKYFAKPLAVYKEAFEKSRPQVIGIKEFENNSQNVDVNTKTVTLYFSQPMNVNSRGFDYGPTGEKNVLMVQKVLGFSEDKKSFSYEVKLEPNRHYQSVVTERFRNEAGIPLKAYLINFKTAE
ncbi:hypothetical protein [Pedobacter chitinilyticus]|uniref:DUF2268 domain-containing protein n=1 Tax=Pedobacter chitinilyticus TaxID=2233776 RepID=A0A443YMD3_9SPHI|nr:hypothetical protein [Pedobacter chitinilyticus]RWU04935.1 hypothetical protein DPV69_17385 [Pedobacter chitinilyticus]